MKNLTLLHWNEEINYLEVWAQTGQATDTLTNRHFMICYDEFDRYLTHLGYEPCCFWESLPLPSSESGLFKCLLTNYLRDFFLPPKAVSKP